MRVAHYLKIDWKKKNQNYKGQKKKEKKTYVNTIKYLIKIK